MPEEHRQSLWWTVCLLQLLRITKSIIWSSWDQVSLDLETWLLTSSSQCFSNHPERLPSTGLMGSGIAQVAATSSKFKSITLQDVSQPQLDKAKDSIKNSLLRIKKKDREYYFPVHKLRWLNTISWLQSNVASLDDVKTLNSIEFTTGFNSLKSSSEKTLIVEAVPERLDLKQNIFKDL